MFHLFLPRLHWRSWSPAGLISPQPRHPPSPQCNCSTSSLCEYSAQNQMLHREPEIHSFDCARRGVCHRHALECLAGFPRGREAGMCCAVPVQHQFPPEAARHSLPLPPLISPSLVSHRVVFCSISSPSLRIPPPSSLFSSSSSRLGWNMTAATKS